MHWRFEAWLNRVPVSVDGIEFEAFLKYVSTLNGLVAYRTEWQIYAPMERLAGSIDFVAMGPLLDLWLFDWKRSKAVHVPPFGAHVGFCIRRQLTGNGTHL